MKRAYLLLMGLFAVNAVWAGMVTVQVEGIVDVVNTGGRFGLDGSVTGGVPMTATYVYDTDAAPISSSAYDAVYTLVSASMNIGNYTFMHHPSAADPAKFRVTTGDPGYVAYTETAYFEGTIYVNGAPKTYNQIIWDYRYASFTGLLYGTSHDPTFTDALPTTSFRDISQAVRREFAVSVTEYASNVLDPNRGRFYISGQLTSVEIVPEPGTMTLLALGGLALWGRRKKLPIPQ